MNDSGKKVIFQDNVSYRAEGISITNNLLVREFAQFLIKKIDEKVTAIEKEIIA